MTDEEWGEIALYEQRFGEPVIPPLDFGHVNLSEAEMLAYARQGLAQDHAIDWAAIYAPLPDGANS
jgi:hypothetical protein